MKVIPIYSACLTGLLLIVSLCSGLSIDVGTIPLDCQETEGGDVTCQFTLSPERLSDGNGLSAELAESCIGEVCIRTTIRTRIQKPTGVDVPDMQQESNKNEAIVKLLESLQQKLKEKLVLKESEERVIQIGKATYSPPYSQHGAGVAKALQTAPNEMLGRAVGDDTLLRQWLKFYFELGLAHFDALNDMGLEEDAVFVEIELATNAFQQALSALREHPENSIPALERDSFEAPIHYFLGEIYFLPASSEAPSQALKEYKEARSLYKAVITNWNGQRSSLELAETEKRYANTCAKVGIVIVASLSDVEPTADWLDSMTVGLVQKNEKNLLQANDMFKEALSLYEKYSSSMHQTEGRDFPTKYALALQHAASCAAMLDDNARSRKYFEKAIEIQKQVILPSLSESNAVVVHAVWVSLADIYLNLSTACVQMGDFKCGKETYAESMDIHRIHHVEVPDEAGMESTEELLQQTLTDTLAELDEYRAGVAGARKGQQDTADLIDDPDGMGGGYYYERNDAYEGELLTYIGGLYLTMGSAQQAIGYFEQAMSLLSATPGSRKSSFMADLKAYLAMCHYKRYNFEESKILQLEALDLYQEIHGDGVNPFEEDLAEYDDLIRKHTGTSTGSEQTTESSSSSADALKEEATVDVQATHAGGKKMPIVNWDFYVQSLQNDTETNSDDNGEL